MEDEEGKEHKRAFLKSNIKEANTRRKPSAERLRQQMNDISNEIKSEFSNC